ncbi:MAG: hypothetical protein ACYCUM_04910 [Solirubrobacteraceae bacterium]
MSTIHLAAAVRASTRRVPLQHGRLVYALGTSLATGKDGLRLVLVDRRSLRRGSYALTLCRRRGRRLLIRHLKISIP